MKRRTSHLIIFLLLVIHSVAYAKAYFAGKHEMILKAEVIAIVDITKVEQTKKKGAHWTYRQKAVGTVEKVIKGKLRSTVLLFGQENFICARHNFSKGRFLLFLRRDGGLWTGCNWHLSIRPIKDDKIKWFVDNKTRFEMKDFPLDDIIDEIVSFLDKEGQDRS